MPQRLPGLEVLQPLEQLFPGEVGLIPDQVVPRDARAVGEHVSDRHSLVQFVVVELNARYVLADGLVPIQLPLLHQQAHGHCRKKLGVGGDLE